MSAPARRQVAAGRRPSPWTGRGASWLAASRQPARRGGAAALVCLLPHLGPSRHGAQPPSRAPASPQTAPVLTVARAGEAAVASYHLSVKTVKRSAGRSATAAAAYRHAARIECHREGRTHDYRAKAGVEASLLILPDAAPAWAEDWEALWNAAEVREVRKDSVVAREWELALPAELDAGERRILVTGFAAELVARYGAGCRS